MAKATAGSSEWAARPQGRLDAALARAIGGGALVVIIALLLYVPAASLGEWLANESPTVLTRLASASVYGQLAALFLASSAALFLIRRFGLAAG